MQKPNILICIENHGYLVALEKRKTSKALLEYTHIGIFVGQSST
jgi:hypothetical protein